MRNLILAAGLLPCLAGAAQADERPHLITAFALTRAGDPPARVVEYYGAGGGRLVQQPKVPTTRKHPSRS